MNIEPISTMLKEEMTAKELAEAIDDIWYNYAVYVISDKDNQGLRTAAQHIYVLRTLRNAFCAVDKLN